MKRAAAGLVLSLLFLIVASNSSYAEPSGCEDKTGKGMHEEVMVMTGGMEHRDGGMMRSGYHVWGLLKNLGLDDKQKEAIRDIKNRVLKDTIRKRADVKVARVELREVLHKDPVDINAAEAKLKEMASLVTEIRLSHIKAMEEVKAQLTPEQREKFKENLSKLRHWRGRHGKRGMMRHFEKHEKMQQEK